MRYAVRWLTVSLMVSGILSSACFGGAWTAGKGDMYHKMTVNWYEADKAFNDSGNRHPLDNNGRFSDFNVAYYGEYGLTDTLTVLGSVSYKSMESEDDLRIARTDGFSDLELGVKYQVLTGGFGVVSLQGLVKLPELYDGDDAIALGNDQYDTEFRLLYGKSLYPFIPGYINIEAGYRFRAEEPADELRYLVEFGIDITPSIYSRIKLDGIAGMNNDDPSPDTVGNPTATLDYDLGKLDLALGFNLSERWGLELGYRAEIYGENTASGDNVSLSLIFHH